MNRSILGLLAVLLGPTLLFAQPGSYDVPASTSINDLLPLIAQCVDPLPEGKTEPFFSGLGTYSCPVAFQGADARKAQRYFDQGLTLWYGFNMPESLLSFAQAAEYDRDAPMAYWGIALAAGPDVNHARPRCLSLKLCYVAAHTATHKAKARALEAGVSEDDVRRFTEAVRTFEVRAARAVLETYRSEGAVQADAVQRSLRELACAAALAQRFDREPSRCAKCGLEATYRSGEAQVAAFRLAMQGCSELFPADPEVALVYTASLLQVRPWRWWGKDKKPTPETATAIEVLQGVLATNLNHPGANHFFIHAVEEGPLAWIEKALPSAERLPRLVPSSGHLQHMSSHIYRNLGRYDLATEANERAVAADRRYLEEAEGHHPVARYPLHYLGHNLHFLNTTQIAQGRRVAAQDSASQLLDLVVEYAGRDGKLNKELVHAEAARFLTVPLTTSLQFDFDQWEETHDRVAEAQRKVTAVLEQAGDTDADLPYTRAMLAYGKTWHSLTQRDWKAALRHASAYQEMTRRPDSELQTNPTSFIYKIASNVLVARASRVAWEDGPERSALVELLGILESPLDNEMPTHELELKAWRLAVEEQDRLYYNDPPEWYYPVRQSLGAAYYLRDRFVDAENTFSQDLELNPGNPRSLHGLIESLRKQEKPVPIDLEQQFKKLWGNNPPPSFKAM